MDYIRTDVRNCAPYSLSPPRLLVAGIKKIDHCIHYHYNCRYRPQAAANRCIRRIFVLRRNSAEKNSASAVSRRILIKL